MHGDIADHGSRLVGGDEDQVAGPLEDGRQGARYAREGRLRRLRLDHVEEAEPTEQRRQPRDVVCPRGADGRQAGLLRLPGSRLQDGVARPLRYRPGRDRASLGEPAIASSAGHPQGQAVERADSWRQGADRSTRASAEAIMPASSTWISWRDRSPPSRQMASPSPSRPRIAAPWGVHRSKALNIVASGTVW